AVGLRWPTPICHPVRRSGVAPTAAMNPCSAPAASATSNAEPAAAPRRSSNSKQRMQGSRRLSPFRSFRKRVPVTSTQHAPLFQTYPTGLRRSRDVLPRNSESGVCVPPIAGIHRRAQAIAAHDAVPAEAVDVDRIVVQKAIGHYAGDDNVVVTEVVHPTAPRQRSVAHLHDHRVALLHVRADAVQGPVIETTTRGVEV